MNNKKTLGLIFLCSPFLLIIFYGLVIWLIAVKGSTGPLSEAFSAVGILFPFMLFLLFPIGLYLIYQSYRDKKVSKAKGEQKSEFELYLNNWNWGAFFITPFWGIFNRTWLALLAFIPYLGVLFAFYFGYKGNKLAWKNQKWVDESDFKQSQERQATVGLVFFLVVNFVYIYTLIA